MFEKVKGLFCTSTSSIGSKSNNNTVIQNSSINNLVVCNNTTEFIPMMAEAKRYDMIQNQVAELLLQAKRSHPLYPVFSATYNEKLNKLVSTPETEDAFSRYPKSIKGAYLFDKKEFPYMDDNENIWEYSYRTQTKMEMKTTAYKEYLGEHEDPFPVMEYQDGMITVLEPPPFPPAVEVNMIAGDIIIPVMIRRKPCMEYGVLMFETVSNECGFNVNIIVNEKQGTSSFRIDKTLDCSLYVQVQREKWLEEIQSNRLISIMLGDAEILRAVPNEKDLDMPLFKLAPYIRCYIENLLTIEHHTGCKFSTKVSQISMKDYNTARIMASSIEGKWYCEKKDFDNTIRCDYDKLPKVFCSDKDGQDEILAVADIINISLYGQCFTIDKYIIGYKHARINNLTSVIKNRDKKKKQILLTFRPIKGHDTFFKYQKFEGISLLSE
ncbi:MAG: hypothetical protein IJO83_00895 [Clostridia bacterium]|nr:hypothetical protein [Clostridia bacterium]